MSMNIDRAIQQQGLDAVNAEIIRIEQERAESWKAERDHDALMAQWDSMERDAIQAEIDHENGAVAFEDFTWAILEDDGDLPF